MLGTSQQIQTPTSIIAHASVTSNNDETIKKKERTSRLHYAHGKQEEVMEQEEIVKRYNNAYLDLQQSAYFFCIDYTGARKSEICELPISKIKLTSTAGSVKLSFGLGFM